MTLGNPRMKDRPHEWDATVPGMAHFAGTGPVGKFCGDCRFRNTKRKPQTSDKLYYFSGCLKFKLLTGMWGSIISAKLRSCKYFEEKRRKNHARDKAGSAVKARPSPAKGDDVRAAGDDNHPPASASNP